MSMKETRETRSQKTKKLSMCAMLAALGVILLWLGSMVSVMDISMAVLASLLCIFAVIEYGGSAPWLVFLVTGLLSVILLPQKAPAVMYLLFFGYYPILKERMERKRKPIAWLAKELCFNVALAVMLLSYHFLFMAEATPWIMYVGFAVLAEVVFPIYDLALTRLISFYLYHLRKRLRIK